ncbi:MAG: DeoR/GlpR transcriptional regulator [Pseudonocardia sp.]|nr:DeoR/GlpR transcriptional regulator [Pseudonocardia sp.]
MDIAHRHKTIVETVADRARVTVAELAALTQCSEMTIRRDLESLESAGVLRRVHGGAERIPLSAIEPPYALRALSNTEAKRALARACSDLLADGESVVLDAGTTAVQIAKVLRGRRMTIAPLSVQVLCEIASDPTTSLLVPGGSVRPGEQTFVGEPAEQALGAVRFDTLILACCGLDAEAGATTHHLDDARVKRAALASATRVMAVVTADKLGKIAFGKVCSPQRLDLVVTDAPATAQPIKALRAIGVQVCTVPVNRES